MQNEITESCELVNEHGGLSLSGWARALYPRYSRSKLKASGLRIKEWDYYEIINPEYGIVLLIYDVGYQARAIVKWIDFKTGNIVEDGLTLWFTRGSMNLPSSSDSGDIHFEKDGVLWECLRGKDRTFRFRFPDFPTGALEGEICLTQPPNQDTIVNVIPFKNKKQFVYAQKINCMRPSGHVTIAGKKFHFNKENRSTGCLDWSRAVFPYHVQWRWCTVSGWVNDVPFGLNIDYGFGSESNKSMIFYNDRGHHLNKPRFSFSENNPMDDWLFHDDEGRVDLRLKPMFLEDSNTNLIIIRMKVVKAYGYFTGSVILDDGTEILIKEDDRLFGSAEAVVNHW